MKGIWKDLEGGRERQKSCNFIKISNKKTKKQK